MTYGIIKCINGHYFIHAEGFTELEKAKVNFHALCQTLWNAPDVLTAEIMIVDEQLSCVEGYREFIHHDVPEPEPDGGEEEPTEGE